jgi:uncharacterized delta-60 repeat protein
VSIIPRRAISPANASPNTSAATALAIIAAALLALLAISPAQTAQAAIGDVNTSFSQAGFTDDPTEQGTSIALMHDGKTLVCVTSYNDSLGGWKSLVARLDTDGALDPTFGTGGIVPLFNFQGDEYPNETRVRGMLELLPSEKILLAVERPIAGGQGTTLVRLNADGTLDTTFAAAGYADVPARAGATDFLARSLTIQQNDTGPLRLLLSGDESVGGSSEAVVVALTLDGALDTAWASGGYVLPHAADFSRVDALTTQADGAFFVLTFAAYGTARVASVSKFDVNGAVVTSFADSGNAVISPESDPSIPLDGASTMFGSALAVDGNGNVVVFMEQFWESETDATDGRLIVLVRLLANGVVDTTFATNGRFASTLIAGGTTSAGDLFMRNDGVIFVVGSSLLLDEPQRFFVAAFTPTGVLDTSFVGNCNNCRPGAAAAVPGVVTFAGADTGGNVTGLLLTPSGRLLTLATVGDNPDNFAQVVAIDTTASTPTASPTLAATGFAPELPALAALFVIAAGLVLSTRRRRQI